MNTLKPCPFCGEQVFTPLVSSLDDGYTRCISCGAKMQRSRWQARPIEDELRKRIAELEAERRWIPVREKPLEPGTFLVLWKNGDIRKDWTYIDGGRYYWWNSGDQVTHYMPLPSFLELPNDTQKDTFVYGKERNEE